MPLAHPHGRLRTERLIRQPLGMSEISAEEPGFPGCTWSRVARDDHPNGVLTFLVVSEEDAARLSAVL